MFLPSPPHPPRSHFHYENQILTRIFYFILALINPTAPAGGGKLTSKTVFEII